MADRTRVGLVGCGFFARNHLNAWRDLAGEGAVLAAVCDVDPAKAKAAAEEFGAARWYSDAAQMLDAEKLDLVDIVTRMDTHRAIVGETLKRKIPTVVQKPFAPEIGECVEMARMARESGTFLAVHENFRFQKPMLRVAELLADRHDRNAELGEIVLPHRLRCLQDATLFPHRGTARHSRHRHPHPRSGAGSSRRGRHRSPAPRSAAIRSCAPRIRPPCCCSTSPAPCPSSNAPMKAGSARSPFRRRLVEIEGSSGAIVLKRDFVFEITENGALRTETLEQPILPWTSAPWHVAQEAVLTTCRHMLQAVRAGREADYVG